MNKIKQIGPGLILCLAIAIPAWLLGKEFNLIGGPVFGIFFGILIGMIFKKPVFEKGINFTSKMILQYSIILLGFEMNLFSVIRVGSQSLFIMLFTLFSAFLTAYFVGKRLKIPGKLAILIGVGTSICGGSAIAATAPVIEAEEKEVAQSISTIFLFNIIAVFIFPALGRLIGLSDAGFGVWAGTAINDTSSVVAAGVAWSETAGTGTALEMATIVKLTRTLMIVPITLVLAVYTSKKKAGSHQNNFHFVKIFPWFVIGFLLAAVLFTFTGIPESFAHGLSETGKFMIVMAMAAIGLNTNLKNMLKGGVKPILLGSICWAAVSIASLAAQWATKTCF